MSALACTADNIALPAINGLNFQNLHADLVTGYSTSLPGQGYWVGHNALNITNLSFCNVSLTYTHEGHSEPIHTHVHLPLEEQWNHRMVGIGGAGWAAGLIDFTNQHMAGAVSEGYVAVATDGGGNPHRSDPEKWVLNKDGSVNMYLLEAFAQRAIGDTADIGKAVAKNFYGSSPKYAYWNGCSQGGRQGYMLAQKYPDAYDGILAAAPAINYPSLIMTNFWAHFIMNTMGEYPHKCEFDALRDAAIANCDHEDGISDGIISAPRGCLRTFDSFEQVGKLVPCPTSTNPNAYRNISNTAAHVIQAVWHGPQMHNGARLYHGHSPDAVLTGPNGRVKTNCRGNRCYPGHPESLGTSFIEHLVRPGVNVSELGPIGYEMLFQSAKLQFDPLLASDDPDLSRFRDRGGKLLSFHGLADEIIPPGGTQLYFEQVMQRDANVHDYYRYFDAPGIGHCFGGIGPVPVRPFADLVEWVENGRVPETLLARSPPDAEGRVMERPLCAYPLVARYRGTGDEGDASNFYCAEDYLSATPIKLVLERAKKYFGFGPKPVAGEEPKIIQEMKARGEL